MPNHIQNRLKVVGDAQEVKKLLDHIKSTNEDGVENRMDFNKIITRPEGMDLEVHEGVKMWVEICTGQIDFSLLFTQMPSSPSEMLKNRNYGDLASRLHASTAMEHLTGKRKQNVKDFSTEELDMFIQCLKNYREHGSTSWYEWNKANWGTKWNAYETNDERNTSDTIYFQTAWTAPIKLMAELSTQFPGIELHCDYADEDSGSNVGKVILKNGDALEVFQPEDGSNEAYEIFLELHPKCDYIKMVDGKYQYVEEE